MGYVLMSFTAAKTLVPLVLVPILPSVVNWYSMGILLALLIGNCKSSVPKVVLAYTTWRPSNIKFFAPE